MIRLVALLAALLASVCGFADPLVLEIYNAATPRPAAECRAVGFNALVVGNRDQLDLCLQYGFHGVFSGLPHTHRSFDADRVREVVESVRDHPALLGYVLMDEPDLRPWDAPPNLVADMAAAVKAADPHHPVMATFAGFLGALSLVAYLDAVDIIRLDSYPFFNRRPLTWAMEVLDACRAATGDRKPIWLIQQAWSDNPTFPPPADDLCLTYLALIHGVQGIGHYAYRFGDRGKSQTLPEHQPEFWAHLQAATAHLAAIHELNDPPANARLLCGSWSGRVEWALKERNGELLLLLCNPSELDDVAVIKIPDSDGRLASFVLGRPLENQSTSGTPVPMRPRETLLLRIASRPPLPECRSVLPLTLELHQLGADSNAYERVLIRNSGETLEGSQLIIRDEEGKPRARTITDIPPGVASERVVYVGEPVTQRLLRAATACVELLDRKGTLRARTLCGPASSRVERNGYRAAARLVGDVPLKRGEKYDVETSVALPAGEEIVTATARYYAPGLPHELEEVARPRGNKATVRFSVTVPSTLCPERYEAEIRWLIPVAGGLADLWIPLSVAVRPPVELENSDMPRYLEKGSEELLAFYFALNTETQVTACTLDVPKGWAVTSGAHGTPVSEDDGRLMVSYRVRAPADRFACDTGSLTFRLHDGPSFAVPVDFRVPLEAFAIDEAADVFDPTTWDHADGHRLGTGTAGDLEGHLKLLWNDEFLSLRCAVTDDRDFINAGEGGVWRGDSLQVSILAMPKIFRTPEMGEPGFANFGFAYDSENEDMLIDLGFVGQGIDGELARASLRTMGRRENGVTTYTIVIPWEAIGANIADARNAIRFSLLINDYDQPDRSDRHWLEFGGGIVRGTDPVQFADLLLID